VADQLRAFVSPGDILLVNNLGVMYSRDAFDDESIPLAVGYQRNNKQHLPRLWLRDSNSQPPVDRLQCVLN
jgi:hypothetical protein